MRRLMLLALLFSSMTLFSSFGFPADKNAGYTSPFDITIFSTSKEYPALYKNYRKDWERLSGFELSSLHWNQFIAVFINANSKVYRHNYEVYLYSTQDDYEDEYDEDKPLNYFMYPVGTIIAKEGFTSHEGMPGMPLFIVMMKKHSAGYDTKHGDWEYFKFAPDGTTLLQGSSESPAVMTECAGCHINVAERDYIFTSFLTTK